MPTPPALDFDALIAPVPGEDPSGSSLPFALRELLDQARKEVDPSAYDAKDPTRPTEPKFADWRGIIQNATTALAGTSKDLILAARLTEAHTKLNGFAGLRDSVRLLHLLVDQCWDRLRPPIEEPDDLEARASAFNWLDDEERGARFPFAIRQAPLLNHDGQPIRWVDWQQLQAGKGSLKLETFERAIAATPREHFQQIVDDLTETSTEIDQLALLLGEKMGSVAPSLSVVRRAVSDCLSVAQLLLGRKGPAPVEAASEDAAATAASGDAEVGNTSNAAIEANFADRSARSRAEIYRRLGESADLLQKIEPHSPIPYLIRRAIELGDLAFPDLLKRLVSDAKILSDVGRSLGIKELQE